jgi:hypothetical protein
MANHFLDSNILFYIIITNKINSALQYLNFSSTKLSRLISSKYFYHTVNETAQSGSSEFPERHLWLNGES